ncbi:MAG: recombinase family protein [Oscillospiraceae bacterium]|nr:recombinase family protein [Oscillospiraceae bacterium]
MEGQINDCIAYAKREGYNVVGEYIDRALSGKTDERPQFLQMMNDSAKEQFQIVIVWKLDRFARNRFDSAFYKRLLKKNGVKVVSATERISDDPEGIILEGVLEAAAEYFSANLAQNVKRGQRENMAKGLHVGGYAAYGYNIVDKKLVVVEDEAAVVRYAFTEYAKGTPKAEIIKELSKMGLLSKKGTPIAYSTLHNILKNEKYYGVYLFGEGEVEGGCPAIIDKELYDKVQVELDKKSRGKGSNKAKIPYLLSGKVFCGMCGEKLFGNFNINKQGKPYAYYQCMGRKFKRNCLKKSERKDFLEWYVVEQTKEYVLQPARAEYIASRIVTRYNDEFNDKEMRALENQLSKIERDINTAVENTLEVPKEARQVFFDRITLLTAQKADVEHELTVMRIATRRRWTEAEILKWILSFSRGDELDADFQRRIIDTFINSVYAYDDKVVIYYNVKDGKQVSHIDMIDSMDESADDTPLDTPHDSAVTGEVVNMDSVQSPLRKRFQISIE